MPTFLPRRVGIAHMLTTMRKSRHVPPKSLYTHDAGNLRRDPCPVLPGLLRNSKSFSRVDLASPLPGGGVIQLVCPALAPELWLPLCAATAMQHQRQKRSGRGTRGSDSHGARHHLRVFLGHRCAVLNNTHGYDYVPVKRPFTRLSDAARAPPAPISLSGRLHTWDGQSIFDYADFALSLFPDIHVGPIICAGQNGKSDPIAIRILHQMRKRFGMHLIELPHWPPKPTQIDPLLVSTNTTDLYIQKYGTLDGVLSTAPGVRNLVHAVMDARHPHGDVYARNSASLPGCWRTSNQSAGGAQNCAPVVPHVVRPPEGGKDSSNDASDLREELGIAPNATVFGRHGATFTFSLRFVRRAVIEIAHNRSDIVFLFLTTDPFCENYGDGPCPRNIIHLNASYDRLRFIRTCDAMLHGRRDGETFGLAVGEFGVHNRPVLT